MVWTDWLGGDCPVDGNTIVLVRFRDGIVVEFKADLLGWLHKNDSTDIVAYAISGSLNE